MLIIQEETGEKTMPVQKKKEVMVKQVFPEAP